MLTAWTGFFALTGAAAATLTGLMFVVITLVSSTKTQLPSRDGLSTFSTPTVLHYATALLVSCVLSAPWSAPSIPAVILGLSSLFGAVHMCRVLRRTMVLEGYRADFEDWIWFNILPLGSYVVLLAGSVLLPIAASSAVYCFGAGVLLQLFVGIHNAWDIVTYLAVKDSAEE